ncbi:MAG: tetratricopeptide repeat protein [Candidatus Paceibacteria bacterium]
MSFLESVREKEQQGGSWLSKLSVFIFIAGSIVLPLFFLPVVQDFINTPKLYFLYGIDLIVLFLFLLEMVISKRAVFRSSFLGVPILVFILISVISAGLSIIPSISLIGKAGTFVLNFAFILALGLWFWLLVQVIKTTREWQYLISSLLISGCVAGLVFLFKDISIVNYLLPSEIFNPVSNSNSLFGIFMATIGIMALGLMQIKERRWEMQILPLFTVLISVASLLRLGFDTPLIIFSAGLALLLVIGTVMLESSRTSVISLVFGLFIGSTLMLFLGVPDFATANLPSEVSINASTSWSIASDTALEGIKSFLVGSGPGTFVQDFSKYRPESMNMNSIAWTTRFERPYNTFFALLSEFGILGLVAFFGVIFVAAGGIYSGWNKTRPSVWQKVKDKLEQEKKSLKSVRLEVFIVVIAWFCVTLGMFFSFYDVALWWLWITTLGLSVVGLASLVPSFVQEKRLSLEVSPRYSLLLSFGMIVLVTVMVLAGGYGTQIFLADMSFTKAVNASDIEKKGKYIQEALSYRESYAPYKVAQARYFLNKARQAAQKENNNRQVAQYLSKAVNTTKEATDSRPNSVETWEALASMYLNSQRMVPGANEWAIKALKKAIELEPTNPELHRKLGNAYAFAGQNDKAKESFRKAIQLKPDYAIAYIQFSNLLASQEKFTQAISLYQPIFSIIKDSPRALFNLGRLYYNRNEKGDMDRAKQVLRRAVDLSPNYANALYALGLVYRNKGDVEQAQQYFDKVRKLTGQNIQLEDKRRQVENPQVTPKNEQTTP